MPILMSHIGCACLAIFSMNCKVLFENAFIVVSFRSEVIMTTAKRFLARIVTSIIQDTQ